MKLTYWVAECLDDSSAYSIRAKTKREAVERRSSAPDGYGPVKKVTIEYSDGFDLMDQCMCEGRGWWESE